MQMSCCICICVCVTVFVECANVCLLAALHRIFLWKLEQLQQPELASFFVLVHTQRTWPPSHFPRSLTAPATRSEALHICMERSFLMKIQVQVGQVCVLSLLSAIRSSNQIESKQLLPLLLLFVVVASLCCCVVVATDC